MNFKKKLLQDLAHGPMSFDHFMGRALAHYYDTRDPFNGQGDFVTSPEISQMFGEMIALFFMDYWKKIGCPRHVNLVEMGPGRGTLMSDFLRIAQRDQDFFAALSVHLVEMSSTLRKIQLTTLSKYGVTVTHHDDWCSVPDDEMLFVVANEFFDALPVQQVMYKDGKFFEKYVQYNATQDQITPIWLKSHMTDLTDIGFGSLESRSILQKMQDGDTVEFCKAARLIAKDMGGIIKKTNGLALIIDYGYTILPIGDSIQAVKGHKPVNVFECVGDADITAHVDFGALYLIFSEDAIAYPIMTQGDFLRGLGIEVLAQKYASQENGINNNSLVAMDRLTISLEMGNLFKVLAVTGSDVAPVLWQDIT